MELLEIQMVFLEVDKVEVGHLEGCVVVVMEDEGVAIAEEEDEDEGMEGVVVKRYLQKILMLIWRSIMLSQCN